MKPGDIVWYATGYRWPMTVEAVDGDKVSLVWFERRGEVDADEWWEGPYRDVAALTSLERVPRSGAR